MRAAALLLALLLVAPLAPVARAAPVLDSGGGASTEWVAWRVHTDGRPWQIVLRADGFAQALGAGLMIVDDGGNVRAAVATVVDASHHGVSVRERVNGVALRQQVIGDANGWANAQFTFSVAAPGGSWRVLVWTAGGASSWSYSFAADGATLVAKSNGPTTHLVAMSAADGGSGARVDTFGQVARADAFATKPLAVQHGMYAITVSNGFDFVRMRAAGGDVPCQRGGGSSSPCGFARDAPGTYTAEITGVATGYETAGEFHFLVADARLPA